MGEESVAQSRYFITLKIRRHPILNRSFDFVFDFRIHIHVIVIRFSWNQIGWEFRKKKKSTKIIKFKKKNNDYNIFSFYYLPWSLKILKLDTLGFFDIILYARCFSKTFSACFTSYTFGFDSMKYRRCTAPGRIYIYRPIMFIFDKRPIDILFRNENFLTIQVIDLEELYFWGYRHTIHVFFKLLDD